GLVARRALNQVFVELMERSDVVVERKDYALGAIYLEVGAELRPESAGLAYNLACVYALGGEKRRALEALRLAVDRGFADRDLAEHDRDLDSLRSEPEF